MQRQKTILIQLPHSNPKLERLFPNDPRGDFSITFKTKTYKLSKGVLLLYSHYFKQLYTQGQTSIVIPENSTAHVTFNSEQFDLVLRSMYGGRASVPAQEVLEYFTLARFLKIEELTNSLREYVAKNIKDYQILEVVYIGYSTEDSEIFQIAVNELETRGYLPLKEDHFQTLSLPLDAFKYIIRLIFKSKGKGKDVGLSNTQIVEIITAYAEGKEYGPEETLALRHQLVNTQFLTASEYQTIFHEELLKHSRVSSNSGTGNYGSTRGIGRWEEANQQSSDISNASQRRNNSVRNKSSSRRQTVANGSARKLLDVSGTSGNKTIGGFSHPHYISQSENLLYKKTIRELEVRNQELRTQLRSLHSNISSASVLQSRIEDHIKTEKASRTKKANLFEEIRKRIQNLELINRVKNTQLENQQYNIDELKEDMALLENRKKNKSIYMSTSQTAKMLKTSDSLGFSVSKPYLEESVVEELKIENCKNGSRNSNKKGSNTDQTSLKGMNCNARQTSISNQKGTEQIKTPIKDAQDSSKKTTSNTKSNIKSNNTDEYYIPTRMRSNIKSDFNSDRIQFDQLPQTINKQECLKLLDILNVSCYEKANMTLLFRASSQPFAKNEFLQAIENHQKLVFLIEIWQSQKIIGAYLSQPISITMPPQPDPEAFIFSITHNKKFLTKSAGDSVWIPQEETNLLSFNSDLILNANLLQECSWCNWPSGYQGDKSLVMSTKPEVWLAGDKNFQVSQLEVYSMEIGEMEMKL